MEAYRPMMSPKLITAIALLLSTGAARTGPLEDMLQKTMPLLPPYCKARLEQVGPAYEYWKQRLGPGFLDVHHYCFGLAEVMTSRQTFDPSRKKELLQSAITNFTYVTGRTKPGELTVLADVYMDRGKAYIALHEAAKATADFNRAIELKRGIVK